MRKPASCLMQHLLLHGAYCISSTRLRLVSLLFLCVFAIEEGYNQSALPTLVLNSKEVKDISPYLAYLAGATNEAFSWPSFQQHPAVSLKNYRTDIAPNDLHWLVIELTNDASAQEEISEWILHFPLLLTDVEYVLVVDGQPRNYGKSGAFVPVRERSFAPTARGNFGKISLAASATATLYLGLKMERSGATTDFRVQLLPATDFHQSRTNEQLFNGVFIGFMLLMFLYNLFLYLQVKDEAFVYYSAYLFGLMLYGLYTTGNLADGAKDWFFPETPQYVFFFKLSTYLGIFAYLVFLRGFLNLHQILPIWDKIFKWLGWLSFPVMLVDALIMYRSNFNYASADVFTLGYAIAFLVLTFSFLIPLWRQKAGGKKRYFIIAGVAAMGVGILMTIIQRIQFVEYSSLYFRLGTIIEVVIFSLGLAYRQRENQLEQQTAVFALERAEMLQQQKETEAQRLAELDEAKNRFYTHITHEFRTPLTVIMGVTDQLSEEAWQQEIRPSKQPDFSQSLSLIKRNSRQLLVQVNQLLDLSKLESGAMSLSYIQANVISFLEYLTESFHSLAQEKNIRLLFYSEEREVLMDFDESKLQYIVYNLLSNAVKFSDDGGKVVLHAKRITENHINYLQLKVSDTGRGISPEHQQNIFDRFYQVESPQEGQMGTGVGLTLTKELIELTGGHIELESELNKGSVFTIILPIRNEATLVNQEELKEAALNTSRQGVDTNLQDTDTNDNKEEQRESTDQNILLLVEDNKDIVSFLKKLLTPFYQVEVAHDGKKGIQMAFDLIPDIIISDIMMPGASGLTLTNTLKADERTSHIPIVLLTAKAGEVNKMEGLRQGADAYLLKPFNKEELLLRLENLLSLRQSVRKQYNITVHSAENGELQKDWTAISVDELFLKKLEQVVKARISDTNFATSDLSTAANLSQSQLYRKLKAITGDTPNNYIRNIRLNHSLSLLKDQRLNISEVAYQSGFNDPNYFSRAFHKLYGKSPTHFRE